MREKDLYDKTTIEHSQFTRNKKTIQNLYVAFSEASDLMKEMLKEQINNEWNSIKFLPEHKRTAKIAETQKLWADGTLVNLERGKLPTFYF